MKMIEFKQFADAVIDNNVEKVKAMLPNISEKTLNQRSPQGSTVLEYACWVGNLEMVKVLLADKRLLVNKLSTCIRVKKKSKEIQFWSALQSAACQGHTSIVKALLDNGGVNNKDVRNHDDETAQDIAQSYGHSKIVKLLSAYDSPCSDRAIIKKTDTSSMLEMEQKYKNKSKIVKAIEQKYKNKRIIVEAMKKTNNKKFPNAKARKTKNLIAELPPISKINKKFISTNQDDSRSFATTVVQGDVELLKKKLLVETTKTINKEYFYDGAPALHYACSKGDTETVKVLLKSTKVEANKTDYNGWSALHWAIKCRQTDVIEILSKSNRVDKSLT